MSPWVYFLAPPLLLVFLYLAVRLSTSAYFKSKSEALRKKWENITHE